VLPGDQTHAPQADELRPLISRDFKLSFLEPPPDTGNVLKQGLERLVHHLRGIQIGVALGGGAARGMAHLGVLKALESSGIVVDMIAGTSAGAMSGTVYSAGMDVDYAIDRFVHDLRPGWFFRSIPKGDQWYLVHKYRRGQFDPMLRKYLGDATLEQLPVPMHSITVDLIEGRAVMRDTGDAVCSIIESINLPGISVPINRDGRSLIDGGLMNNVPADVLVSLGCNFVIAVSVTAKIKNEFARNKPDTPTDQMRHASAVETILRSYLVQSHGLNEFGVQPADMVIEPDVTRFKLTDFVLTDELAEVGHRATIDSIPEIKRQLAQLDSALFNSTEATSEQPNL
jgi:predicted acylesterase/phospholipase RssA